MNRERHKLDQIGVRCRSRRIRNRQRLAAFHSDREQPAARRAEAEGVLRIQEQRMVHLKRLLDLREPEIVPLGVLMLIPEVKHGA